MCENSRNFVSRKNFRCQKTNLNSQVLQFNYDRKYLAKFQFLQIFSQNIQFNLHSGYSLCIFCQKPWEKGNVFFAIVWCTSVTDFCENKLADMRKWKFSLRLSLLYIWTIHTWELIVYFVHSFHGLVNGPLWTMQPHLEVLRFNTSYVMSSFLYSWIWIPLDQAMRVHFCDMKICIYFWNEKHTFAFNTRKCLGQWLIFSTSLVLEHFPSLNFTLRSLQRTAYYGYNTVQCDTLCRSASTLIVPHLPITDPRLDITVAFLHSAFSPVTPPPPQTPLRKNRLVDSVWLYLSNAAFLVRAVIIVLTGEDQSLAVLD